MTMTLETPTVPQAPPVPRARWWVRNPPPGWALIVFALSAMIIAVAAAIGWHDAIDGPAEQKVVGPSAAQVRAETVAVCSAWATAYGALPVPQSTAMDVLAPALYVQAAVAANPAADPQVLTAVADQARLMTAQAAVLSGARSRGAVQVPTWDYREANTSAAHTAQVCHDYGD